MVRSSRRVRLSGRLAASLSVAFLGIYGFFVHTSAGRGLDDRIFQAVPRPHSMWFRLGGALLGSEALLALVGMGLMLVVGVRARRPRHIVVALSVVAGSVVTAELFKHVLLSRPGSGAAAAVANSYPSGHVTVAAAAAVAVWFVSGPRRRPAVAVFGGVISLVVGVVTVVQEWHRPSDVVGAFVLVASWACAGNAILNGWLDRVSRAATGT